ncbi:MAG: STAS domain-containing protein [Coriobacteriia bacterium]|nr:STAS domain-containing protein [Coriobacteriia bacterium]
MPSFIEAWRAGLFRRGNIMQNVLAGVIVGIVAMPLAMGFAIASGAKPEQGLYTALIAGVIVTLFGGSRVQIAGPTGAFVVLLVGITAKYGYSGLQIVTMLAGAMLLLFGLARLGGVIRVIPESVILGFTAGIAVVMWVGQWQNFFGLPQVANGTFLEHLARLIAVLPQLHPATTALAVAGVVIVALWPKIPVVGEIPGPLVALVVGTGFVALVHPDGVATIGSAFGGIPRGLPPLTIPHTTLSTVTQLLQPAFAVALLGGIESLLSATVADGMTGQKHDANQELIGQGLANMGSGLFGGFAATGALARTATNVRHGGNSPLAGIAHAAVLALVLVALAPLAAYVPLATLAAVLWVVAYNMSDLGRLVRTVRRAPKSDVGVMLVTFVLAVFADLSLAVEVGVVLALLNLFRRMISAVEVRTLEGGELAEGRSRRVPHGVLVYSIDGPFFFGAVEEFEGALAHTKTDPNAIVLDLSRVPFVDLSSIVALREAAERFHARGVTVILCGANASVAEKLERAGIMGDFGLSATETLDEALDAVEAAVAGTPA